MHIFILFWGKWSDNNSQHRQILPDVGRSCKPKLNEIEDTVHAGRGNMIYVTAFDKSVAGYFSQSSDIAAWWHLMASTVSWFESMWFLPMGSPKHHSFFSELRDYRRFKGRLSKGSCIVTSPVCCGTISLFPLVCCANSGKTMKSTSNLVWLIM